MTPRDPSFRTIAETLAAYARGEDDPVSVAEGLLARIGRYDGTIRAFIACDPDTVRAEARAACRQGMRGRLGGIPIAVKDLFTTPGRSATFGSPRFRGGPPGPWAHVLARLRAEGAILIGYTNLDAFALGSFNANADYGQVRNPWDPACHAGGSSGGSAAAVAAGMALAAIGTDTGVSIRQPAAVTGLVGLKPSFGLVGRGGCLPLSPGLDHIGPITRTVADAALILSVIAGHDPGDPQSLTDETIAASGAVRVLAPPPDLAGIRIGVAQDWFWDLCDPDTATLCRAALTMMERLGARLVGLDLPNPEALNAAAATIARAEAAHYHCADPRWREAGYGAAFGAFLQAGSAIGAAELAEARAARARLGAELDRAIRSVAVAVMPTTPRTATPVAEGPEAGETLRWRNTGPFTASGHPALSLPCGFGATGLPVGLQIVGQYLGDSRLMEIAATCEAAMPWKDMRPECA